MELLINQIERNKLRLKLKEGKQVLDTVDFAFDKNVDTLLIGSIDKFLKRNKIDILSLKTVNVSGDIDKNSSLYKVIQTWIAAVKTIQKSM